MARQAGSHIPASTAFLERTYNETLALLLETQSYVANSAATERAGLSWMDALRADRDLSRLTARLAEVLAWLFVQKAVDAGELSRGEALSAERRLGNRQVCLDEAGDYEGDIPPQLEDLLGRTRALYVRAARLDEMVARSLH
ncbi:MAG: DUF1465 family protein [Alphaproteobacteria bacterium]|nr:DUF1465 family protein [Alphaproteobacteria bacterium]